MPIFSFIRDIVTELFGKLTIGNKYINKRAQLYSSNDLCLQNNVLKRKNISCDIPL